jgi:hypothetical protein
MTVATMPRYEERAAWLSMVRTRQERTLPPTSASDRKILEPAAPSPNLSGRFGRFADSRSRPTEWQKNVEFADSRLLVADSPRSDKILP